MCVSEEGSRREGGRETNQHVQVGDECVLLQMDKHQVIV